MRHLAGWRRGLGPCPALPWIPHPLRPGLCSRPCSVTMPGETQLPALGEPFPWAVFSPLPSPCTAAKPFQAGGSWSARPKCLLSTSSSDWERAGPEPCVCCVGMWTARDSEWQKAKVPSHLHGAEAVTCLASLDRTCSLRVCQSPLLAACTVRHSRKQQDRASTLSGTHAIVHVNVTWRI